MVRRLSLAAMTEPTRPSTARVKPSATRQSTHLPDLTADGDAPAPSAVEAVRTPIGGLFAGERAQVIRSKIQPPPLRSSTLSRQRLLDRLNDATSSRLTLVVAEAGYGKTTLLADFSSRASARCLWYKLDPTDADPITWTNYVIAAAREVDPTFGEGTLSLLAQVGPGGPPESAFISSLLGELPRLGEAPTILVLDDFQEVDESPDAREFVSRLLKDAPPWLHFVISSRRRPTLELARLAGMGEVAEITTDDLRFTYDETDRLFSDSYGLALDADVLTELGTRARGWAASLQLFHSSARGRPSNGIRTLAHSLSGAASPMYDFLAQEVLKNVHGELEEFLIRISLLDQVTPNAAMALFPDRHGLAPSNRDVANWIAECDRLGLLTRTSESSEARHLHPLLRDFLIRALDQRHEAAAVREFHRGLADHFAKTDPLTASQHFIEAGLEEEAIASLGGSVMFTMGSGQWGAASRLIDSLGNVRSDPAVAAIRARRLIDEGDLASADTILRDLDLAGSLPEVRAAVRHAQIAVGWRRADRDAMYSALHAIQGDAETPEIMREIAETFVDASPLSARRATMPSLGKRLTSMAASQQAAGLHFYAAVSLHNATIAFLNAGDLRATLRTGDAALAAFDALTFPAVERLSTHSIIATTHLELGSRVVADEHIGRATVDGEEFADVAAEVAFDSLVTGDRKHGLIALARAESLVHQGQTDTIATFVTETAAAFSALPNQPSMAIERLQRGLDGSLMDFGQMLSRQIVLALALLLSHDRDTCLSVAEPALAEARSRLSRRAEARLQVLVALGREDSNALTLALSEAAAIGELALLELADGIACHLDLLATIPPELEESIARWPARWLAALRAQLDKGDTPPARSAARLLDKYGEVEDVSRLRAYARTYRRRGRLAPLGIDLAQRVSPQLRIQDLGRVTLSIGDRSIALAGIRRKPASLLMYLVTRPSFSANREQVFDELWPDTDPGSASNSLNQSLYFLRRELDPWYEDDISVDYLAVQGELVWLDPGLVRAQSAQFVEAAAEALKGRMPLDEVVELVGLYRGPFASEFEYEDWAMAWRSRVHTTFLELASRTIDRAVVDGDLDAAREIAVNALDADFENTDIERKLVWLYWHLGARAAAAAQHHRLSAREKADGFEPISLEEIVSALKPT